MEGLLFILIIVFLVATGGKKKQAPGKPGAAVKPGSAGQSGAAVKPGASARPVASPADEPMGVARLSPLERAARLRMLKERQRARAAEVRTAEASRAAQAPAAATAMPQGASAFDDEGCLGGSLSHDHSEGEGRAEHARHIAAMEARDAEEAAVAAPKGLADFDPRDLRRAVVISEILGKPRALRSRR